MPEAYCCYCCCSFAVQVPDSRALSAIPEHNIMLAGDKAGAIKIFSWKAQ
jgi:hypothetical protein